MVQLMGKFEVVPLTIYGTNAVGVYIFANNKYALVPQDAPQRLHQGVIDALSVEIVPITIAKSNLIGIFIAGNDNGIILPNIATDDEVNQLRKSLSDINIEIMPTKYTALSNLILANNRVALVSSIIEKELLRRIADVLDTEVIQGELCGSYVIGSIALVNDNGVLLTPDASDDDVKTIRDIFKVKVNVGTVNRGIGFVRGGSVVNNRGAIVGGNTTGFEIMRIIETLSAN